MCKLWSTSLLSNRQTRFKILMVLYYLKRCDDIECSVILRKV